MAGPTEWRGEERGVYSTNVLRNGGVYRRGGSRGGHRTTEAIRSCSIRNFEEGPPMQLLYRQHVLFIYLKYNIEYNKVSSG